MSDTPADTPLSAIEYFRTKALEAAAPQTRANLIRAVDALASTAGPDLTLGDITYDTLSTMAAHLLYRGLTPATIADSVVRRLSTLHNKAVADGLAAPTTAYAQLRDALAALPAGPVIPGAFAALRDIILTDYSATPALQLAKDMLLAAIYGGGLTLGDIAAMRTDAPADNPHLLDIISRNTRPRRRYLFPLGQGRLTPRQSASRAATLIHPLLTRHRLTLTPEPGDTPLHLWASAAMACGIPPIAIAAALSGRAARSPLTALLRPTAAAGSADRAKASAEVPSVAAFVEARTDVATAAVRDTVADTLALNPPRWWALHLRQGVTAAALADRLADSGLTPDDTYYPTQEIARRTRRHTTTLTQPLIPWLLFIRAPRTHLPSITRAAGDLAWAYRTTAAPGAPYASISDADMRRFQAAVGQFTPDTDIRPLGTTELRPDDRVILLLAPYAGRQARVTRLLPAPGGRLIIRVAFTATTGIEWTLDADPRALQPLHDLSTGEQ